MNAMANCNLDDWETLAVRAKYSSRDMAMLCRFSTRQLQRRFQQQFGRSPQKWLNEKRLTAAQHLLLSGQPVKAVAFELGFKQPSHFCRKFKLSHKMTASEFVLLHFNPPDERCRS